jgi:hypothetical protein
VTALADVTRLCTLLEELSDRLRHENELLQRMAFSELGQSVTAKTELLEVYERELAGLRASPDRLRDLPPEERVRFEAALGDFQNDAQRNLALVTSTRGIVERLVRRLAAAVGGGDAEARPPRSGPARPLAFDRSV